MDPIKEYLFNPDPDIGGATVPLVGPPGSGKSVALTQIGIRNITQMDHRIIWRGTKQAQWGHFLANNIPVTIWNNENIADFKAYISGNKNHDSFDVDLTEKADVKIKTWSSADELVDRLDDGRVNVVNVPGLQGDNQDTQHHLYFLRKTWIDIFDAIIERENLQFITMLLDECGDLFPCQQQLRDPYYKLVVEMLPPKLSQLRKQNCFFYPAAHSTHDMHYFLWKIKSNSIIYKSNAIVKKEVTPGIDQSFVANMERGEFAMPYKSKDHFELPKLISSLDWVPNGLGRELRLSWESNAPNLLGKENEEKKVDGRKRNNLTKGQAARKAWKNSDKGQKYWAEKYDIDVSAISKAEID